MDGQSLQLSAAVVKACGGDGKRHANRLFSRTFLPYKHTQVPAKPSVTKEHIILQLISCSRSTEPSLVAIMARQTHHRLQVDGQLDVQELPRDLERKHRNVGSKVKTI